MQSHGLAMQVCFMSIDMLAGGRCLPSRSVAALEALVPASARQAGNWISWLLLPCLAWDVDLS